MSWVVDTCLLIDVLEDDPEFGRLSAQILDGHAAEGLLVSPVTYAELSPAFHGDLSLQDEFLGGVGVGYREEWAWSDTLSAHAAWCAHIRRRRGGQGAKRPLADIFIGAFALRFQGLLTRNPEDFQTAFPSLTLRTPKRSGQDLRSP
jgi:predicted nucleic acid-binding protein